jgi:hypothetical protein
LNEAAAVSIAATREAMERHPDVSEARFWLFSQAAHDAFSRALQT